MTNPQTGANTDRIRLMLSDGVHRISSMLTTGLNELVVSGSVQRNTVLILREFVVNTTGGNRKCVPAPPLRAPDRFPLHTLARSGWRVVGNTWGPPETRARAASIDWLLACLPDSLFASCPLCHLPPPADPPSSLLTLL